MFFAIFSKLASWFMTVMLGEPVDLSSDETAQRDRPRLPLPKIPASESMAGYQYESNQDQIDTSDEPVYDEPTFAGSHLPERPATFANQNNCPPQRIKPPLTGYPPSRNENFADKERDVRFGRWYADMVNENAFLRRRIHQLETENKELRRAHYIMDHALNVCQTVEHERRTEQAYLSKEMGPGHMTWERNGPPATSSPCGNYGARTDIDHTKQNMYGARDLNRDERNPPDNHQAWRPPQVRIESTTSAEVMHPSRPVVHGPVSSQKNEPAAMGVPLSCGTNHTIVTVESEIAHANKNTNAAPNCNRDGNRAFPNQIITVPDQNRPACETPVWGQTGQGLMSSSRNGPVSAAMPTRPPDTQPAPNKLMPASYDGQERSPSSPPPYWNDPPYVKLRPACETPVWGQTGQGLMSSSRNGPVSAAMPTRPSYGAYDTQPALNNLMPTSYDGPKRSPSSPPPIGTILPM
ncbi:hypothetical protein GHT06_010770 [Daphnia sinensis]|uniref:Uncharacterized protein n=1 Tax=Daphnia sinensis TaxID=1820382 RepID=A0AAD5PXR0_9CRUS|nr:hypothetical protein GHT06_010770 [Daphnia sinensis]